MITLRTLVAAIVLAAATVDAAVIALSFAELVRQADVIFDGDVTDIRSRAAIEGGAEKIFTDVTFRVRKVLKGKTPARTVLEFAGGVVGDRGYKVEDVPTFARGERAVLFVGASKRALSPIVGMMQGRFRVVRDTASGSDLMHGFDDMLLRDVASIGSTAQPPVFSPTPAMSLQAFESAIASEIRHQATIRQRQK